MLHALEPLLSASTVVRLSCSWAQREGTRREEGKVCKSCPAGETSCREHRRRQGASVQQATSVQEPRDTTERDTTGNVRIFAIGKVAGLLSTDLLCPINRDGSYGVYTILWYVYAYVLYTICGIRPSFARMVSVGRIVFALVRRWLPHNVSRLVTVAASSKILKLKLAVASKDQKWAIQAEPDLARNQIPPLVAQRMIGITSLKFKQSTKEPQHLGPVVSKLSLPWQSLLSMAQDRKRAQCSWCAWPALVWTASQTFQLWLVITSVRRYESVIGLKLPEVTIWFKHLVLIQSC